MYGRQSAQLHDRCLLRPASKHIDQLHRCPPWRYTPIPVELFDLMTVPPHTPLRLYRLHYEILQFYQFMKPSEEEHAVRQQVVNRVTAIIHQYLPTASVDIYGSFKTGLYLPTSDIDLIVYSKDGRQWKSAELEKIMSDLREAFCRRHICTHEGIQVLNSATVPIIKLTDHITDLKVDMSFNLNNGPRSAQLILHYLQVYPSLKYLIYVLKQYLIQRNLNEVWTGGISCYSLILMLVCFLQSYYKKDTQSLWSSSPDTLKTHSLPSSLKTSSVTGTTDDYSSSTSYPSSSAASYVSSDDNHSCSNPNSDSDDDHVNQSQINYSCNHPVEYLNLGHMLISFLELYGVYFNYAKSGIRVQTPGQADRPAGFVDKEELFRNFCCGHRTTNNLCIVDPFNDKNDISKASWSTPELNLAFREAFDKLLQSVSNQNTTLNNAPSILSQILTVNESTLAYRERLYHIYHEYQNEQRIKLMQNNQFIYGLLDKTLIEYSNGHPLKYVYPILYQQHFFPRAQSQRTNRLKTAADGDHRKAQE